jgi:hypothetical protein
MKGIAKIILVLCMVLLVVLAFSRHSQTTIAAHADCIECHNAGSGYSFSTHHYIEPSCCHGFSPIPYDCLLCHVSSN